VREGVADRVAGGVGGGVEGLGGQSDAVGRGVGDLVVTDLEAEGLEQGAGEGGGQAVEVERADRQRVQELRVGRVGGVLFGIGELGFQPGLVLPEFGAALVEVADEVLVGVLNQFQVAGQPSAAVVGVGDGPAQRGDALGMLVGGGVGLVAQVGGE
jgi:hypothetical protein